MPEQLRAPDGRFASMNERGQLTYANGNPRRATGITGYRWSPRERTAQREFVYWRRDDDNWVVDRYDDGSHYIDGTWMAEPGDYDYLQCEECGNYTHCDDAVYCYRREVYYCPRHGSAAYDEDWDAEPDYDDEVDDDGRFLHTYAVRCEQCRVATPTHHHPVTEALSCEACATSRAGFELIPDFTWELVAA